MKKFVSYRRVSTEKQGKSGLGLAAQKAIIDYFVAREDGEVIADFEETHSGKDLTTCTKLHEAMKAAKAAGAVLIIAKTDRFRNVAQALQIMDEMGEGQIEFCDLPHTDRFTLTLLFALAERERRITSIRTKQALAAKKAQGFKLGRPDAEFTPEMIKHSAQNRRELALQNENNRRAWGVIQAMEGQPLKAIADHLNANGFKTSNGGAWRGNQVKRIREMMEE